MDVDSINKHSLNSLQELMKYLVVIDKKYGFTEWHCDGNNWPVGKADFDTKFNLYDLRPEAE